MKITVPMPLLARGTPPRNSFSRWIWMKKDVEVDVPEYARSDFETVLRYREPDDLPSDCGGIISVEGRTYRRVEAYNRDAESMPFKAEASYTELLAFPRWGLRGSPGLMAAANLNDMTAFAVSRPVMENQSRRMFLHSWSMDRSNVWPKAPGKINKTFTRDAFDFDTHDPRLADCDLEGLDTSDEAHRKALQGLVFVDDELWAECGKPCIVVTAHYNDVGASFSMGLTTLPTYTDTSFLNAYFPLSDRQDADDFRRAMQHAGSTLSYVDRIPEIEFDIRDETTFDGDAWEAERTADVLGADVMALIRHDPETVELIDDTQREAVCVCAEGAKRKLDDPDNTPSLAEHAGHVIEAWTRMGRRTFAAEAHPNRKTLMEPILNRAIMGVESSPIRLDIPRWGIAP